MNKTLAAIAAAGALAFGCQAEEKPNHPAPEIIEIANGECRNICDGEICYEVMEKRDNSPKRYAIEYGGFDNYSRIGERMIIAGSCILYQKEATSEKLMLEKLTEKNE
ncbi:MAG: hypothetical protein PHO02_06695 [Candidatus Nanoarchaeia archaeon]|nr:hypothetical protein [Candidatus Nanoarchaeia archaeon]